MSKPAEKLEKSTKRGGKRPGSGRKKGVPNKFTQALKDQILGALDAAGGQDYLARQAEENPGPFMALVGKVLPTTLNGTLNHALVTPEQADRIEHGD